MLLALRALLLRFKLVLMGFVVIAIIPGCCTLRMEVGVGIACYRRSDEFHELEESAYCPLIHTS